MSVVMVVMSSVACFAQSDQEDIEVVQLVFGNTKRVFVSEYMKIDNDISHTSFWNLYDEYERKRGKIMGLRYRLIKIYIDHYWNLDNMTASAIVKELMRNSEQTDRLNKHYFRKFEKEIGGTQAATLFQIELYFQTSIQSSIQSQIPLIGQLQKMQESQAGSNVQR